MQKNTCPLVSVVIPVYNVAPYLREALDGVVHQTYSQLEILLIDDGSTDSSGLICDEYAGKDSRIHLIRQDNKGLSAARNVGLDNATGDYIAFLDPDDAFHPEFIETLVFAIMRTNADMALCRYTIHYTEGEMDHNKRLEKRSVTYPFIDPGVYDRMTTLRALAEQQINVSVWNKLYRKDLWEELWFPDGHVYEDIETTYKIAERCEKICVINQSLYLHRKRSGSITTKPSPVELSDWLRAHSWLESYIESHVPEIFSEEMLERCKERFLLALMARYALLRKCEYNEEALRDLIVQTGRSAALEKLEFRTRVAYWMICHTPWLLKGAYPLYRTVRQLIRSKRVI